jgi:serine/threonine protein kinase
MGALAGLNLGPYRILEQVGAGGMATVYKAYHAAMDRYVAIKVLPSHLARDPGFRARFEREARTIARLEHRYILPVHDVGEDNGVPYMVMRYVDSGDLSKLIAKGSLTIPQAVQIVSEVAEALAYAHQQGIIHRDVKPANILIGRDGNPLLTDFGIAKIYEETLQLTEEGVMIGTPTYMAPEQLQGQPVDARSDIYALGVVLYQAVTGEPPFVAETPLAVALMHIHNSLRPPRQINPAITESIERIILRALAKNPNDRFQTANEMAEALARSSVQPPAPAPPAPVQPKSSVTVVLGRRLSPAWFAAGAALVALIGAAFLVPKWIPSAPASSLSTGASAIPDALRAPAKASMVNDMARTSDAVWAVTDGGLVRWSADGTGHAFTEDDGLPFAEPQAIAVTRDGTLWVGGGGVARIRPTTNGIKVEAFYTKDDGLGTGAIRTLMIDSDGSIWAGGPQGTSRFALSHFDGNAWRTDELPVDDPALKEVELQVQSILRSRDGALWLGLRKDGLLRWDGKGWTHYATAQGVGAGSNSQADMRIRRIVQSNDDTLWAAASEQGLLRFDAEQGRWQRVAVVSDGTPIRSIALFADGTLWAAGDGLVARSADNGQTWVAVGSERTTVGADIGSLMQDPAGRVWVGAYEGGVSVFDGRWRALQR